MPVLSKTFFKLTICHTLPYETGGFINSIKATPVKKNGAETYIEVYPQGRAPHGNDRKGDKSNVRYATIGFVAEYGVFQAYRIKFCHPYAPLSLWRMSVNDSSIMSSFPTGSYVFRT